jgi:hypothetical protein
VSAASASESNGGWTVGLSGTGPTLNQAEVDAAVEAIKSGSFPNTLAGRAALIQWCAKKIGLGPAVESTWSSWRWPDTS